VPIGTRYREVALAWRIAERRVRPTTAPTARQAPPISQASRSRKAIIVTTEASARTGISVRRLTRPGIVKPRGPDERLCLILVDPVVLDVVVDRLNKLIGHRSGAAGGMLATARLLGQTTGAVAVAAAFHLSGVRAGPGLLAASSVAAALAALLSLWRPGAPRGASPSRTLN